MWKETLIDKNGFAFFSLDGSFFVNIYFATGVKQIHIFICYMDMFI